MWITPQGHPGGNLMVVPSAKSGMYSDIYLMAPTWEIDQQLCSASSRGVICTLLLPGFQIYVLKKCTAH